MQNILLCTVIDKTAAKYFTQAKYFTVYYETTTTRCTLCTLYVVNVEECKIFHSSTKAKYFTVYDQTTMCELCTLYTIVNVEECKIFALQYYRQNCREIFHSSKLLMKPQGLLMHSLCSKCKYFSWFRYAMLQCYRQNSSKIFHSGKIFHSVLWNYIYKMYIMHSLGTKCRGMQNISLKHQYQ